MGVHIVDVDTPNLKIRVGQPIHTILANKDLVAGTPLSELRWSGSSGDRRAHSPVSARIVVQQGVLKNLIEEIALVPSGSKCRATTWIAEAQLYPYASVLSQLSARRVVLERKEPQLNDLLIPDEGGGPDLSDTGRVESTAGVHALVLRELLSNIVEISRLIPSRHRPGHGVHVVAPWDDVRFYFKYAQCVLGTWWHGQKSALER